MSAVVKLKGPWSRAGTDEDRCHQYWIRDGRLYLADNEYNLNQRWYPIENVARMDEEDR